MRREVTSSRPADDHSTRACLPRTATLTLLRLCSTTTRTASPSLANIPPLPTELLAEILLEDVLNEGDLEACCRTSRILHSIAEPLLYAEATIEVGPCGANGRFTTTRWLMWFNTVEASSRLAALVRRLLVTRHRSKPGDPLCVSPVAIALKACPNLNRIDCVAGLSLRNFDFPAQFASQATLRCLDAYKLEQPTDWNILLDLPNLTHLGVKLDSGAGGPREDERRPEFRLECLRIFNGRGDSSSGPDRRMLDALLHLSHNSLKALELPTTRRITSVINLEQFPNLDRLSLIGYWSDNRSDDDEVDAVVALLGACRALDELVLKSVIGPGGGDAWRDTMPVILTAVPSSVTSLELSISPSVALVGEVLGWVPPQVKLEQLGVQPEYFEPDEPNSRACADECAAALAAGDDDGDGAASAACSRCVRWADEARVWAALEAHCDAKGIELIETDTDVIPFPSLS